jgi:hypothetical protein
MVFFVVDSSTGDLAHSWSATRRQLEITHATQPTSETRPSSTVPARDQILDQAAAFGLDSIRTGARTLAITLARASGLASGLDLDRTRDLDLASDLASGLASGVGGGRRHAAAACCGPGPIQRGIPQ